MLIISLMISVWSPYYLPQKFSMRGLFRLPFGNITEEITAKVDVLKNRSYVKYNENQSFSYWNSDQYSHGYTKMDKLECYTVVNTSDIADKFPLLVPNLTEFVLQPNKKFIRGFYLEHFVKNFLNGSHQNCTDVRNDQQDFYCLLLSDVHGLRYCQPVQWEIHGYNNIHGSHFDNYVLEYLEFDVMPVFTDADFVVPDLCVPQDLPIASVDLFFSSLSRQQEFQQLSSAFTFQINTGLKEHITLGGRPQKELKNLPIASKVKKDLPQSWDLRLKGVITPVKDQAHCGSCWTFGTAGMLEGMINLQRRELHKPLIRVSEQQILSCAWSEINSGCNGGDHADALQKIMDFGRIPEESNYPYTGFENVCDSDHWDSGYNVTSFTTLQANKDVFKTALLDGPISVYIAVPSTFKYYAGGVYNDPDCQIGDKADLVHIVLLVGWGKDIELGEYWIIKNSWGNLWGIDGYMYLSNEQDLCGILVNGVQATIASTILKPKYYRPHKFTMKGTFKLPFGNITEEIGAKIDSNNNLAVLNYNTNVTSSFYNNDRYAHEFTKNSEKDCYLLEKQNKVIPQLVPNLDEFVLQNDTPFIRGFNVTHFVKYSVSQATNDSDFLQTRYDYQDFYCLMLSDVESLPYCQPIRWEMHGRNAIHGSHFDNYVLDYLEFDVMPVFTDADFAIPDICIPSKNHIKISSVDEFFVSLTVQRSFTTGFIDSPSSNFTFYNKPLSADLPVQYDLRLKGVITPVKNQAHCGSCWTFGTAGMLEGRINMLNKGSQKPLIRISEQEILSCTWLESGPITNLGCDGGNHEPTLNILKDIGQLPLEQSYPYTGFEDICHQNKWQSGYRVGDVMKLDSKNIDQFKTALKEGPISVSIAVPQSWAAYSGGIYNDSACGYGSEAKRVHIVLLVGWGKENDEEYWIIKNSWGNLWGMDGYIYVSTKNDLCGIMQNAFVAEILESVTPDKPDYTKVSYSYKGSFSLPIANVSTEMNVLLDNEGKRQRISYNNDDDYSIWDIPKQYFRTVVYANFLDDDQPKSIQYCLIHPTYVQPFGENETYQMLPNLKEFDFMGYTYLQSQKVRHYRLNITQNQDVISDEFQQQRLDQQDFYCIDEESDINKCVPFKWEIHGYNTLGMSHFDYYELQFHEFKFSPEFKNDDFILDQVVFDESLCFDNIHDPLNVQQNPLTNLIIGFISSSIVQQNQKLINSTNLLKEHNQFGFSVSPNQFVGLSYEQFLRSHANLKKSTSDYVFKHKYNFSWPQMAEGWYQDDKGRMQRFPKFIDWRVDGGINPVKDQAVCGSCWTFGAMGVIESRLNIKNINQPNKPYVRLSEQSIVDCIWTKSLLHGCDGGEVNYAIDMMVEFFQGKLALESEYPYLGQDGKCSYESWKEFTGPQLVGFKSIEGQNGQLVTEDQLKYALLSGPVSVSIAVAPSMVFYTGGVYNDPTCTNNREDLIHAVVVTGYGVDDVFGEYWIVRNSWSNAWGVDGYINIAFGYCGILLDGLVPVFDDEI